MSRVLHCKCSKTPHPCSRTPSQTGGVCLCGVALFWLSLVTSSISSFSSFYRNPPQPHFPTHPSTLTSPPAPKLVQFQQETPPEISCLVLTVHSFLLPSYHQNLCYLTKHRLNSYSFTTQSLQSIQPSIHPTLSGTTRDDNYALRDSCLILILPLQPSWHYCSDRTCD